MLSIGPAPLSLGQQQDLRSDSQLRIQLDIANSLRAIAVMMARSVGVLFFSSTDYR